MNNKLIGRLLFLSGVLELAIGLGHNVVGTLALVHPQTLAPIAPLLKFPQAVLAPIAPGIQRDMIVGVFLLMGEALMIFGALLIWQARREANKRDRTLLVFILIQQVIGLATMLVFVRFHWLGIVDMVIFTAALGWAIAKMPKPVLPGP